MKLLKIFFIMAFFIIYAEALNINNKTKQISLLSDSKIYIDYSQKLKIENILKDNTLFKENKKDLLTFGYDPKLNVWIKFTLTNDSFEKVNKIVEYSNSLTTNVEFYSPDNDYSKPIVEGLFNINNNRKTIKPTFSIHLDEYESKTFYIKASSRITTLIVKTTLYEADNFYNKELLHQSILSLFFGAMLILVFYNLFIYFFSKDLSYIFYILYVLGVTYHQLLYTGVLYIYIPNTEIIKTLIFLSPVASAFPIYSLALFCKIFLKLKNYKKLNFIMNNFLIIIPISIIIPLLSNQWSSLRNLFNMLLLLYIIIVAIYLTFKRNKQAYFIVVGWVVIFSAIIFMYLNSLGIFSIYEYLPYYVEGAFLFEAILFSIALADKINSLNDKLIKQKQTENVRLEDEVNKKTKELQVTVQEKEDLLKELNHRVKNNMQNIISLIRIQSDEIKNKKTTEQFISIENRLSAMNHLHEILYKKSDISKVNCYQYLESIVYSLQESYEKDYIDIEYEIDSNLEMETKSISSFGLIINELVTNAFKYAFKHDKGTLFIKLVLIDDTYHLKVKDDGVACKISDFETSFGISLVKDLVEEHLLGSITSSVNNGVEHLIKWKKK